MIQRRWFWVEHLQDGSIGKTGEAEAKGRNGSVIRYYEAVDLADACAQAKGWWAKASAHKSAQYRRRRERQASAGLCQTSGCKSPARPEKKLCQPCQDQSSARYRQRKERREAGDFADLRLKFSSQEERAAAGYQKELARNRRRRASGQVSAYTWMLNRYDQLGPVAFRAWLVSKIPAMQGVPPLAEAAE